jgi:hypothetical protein
MLLSLVDIDRLTRRHLYSDGVTLFATRANVREHAADPINCWGQGGRRFKILSSRHCGLVKIDLSGLHNGRNDNMVSNRELLISLAKFGLKHR